MRSAHKLKDQANDARHRNKKTKDDFLRWLQAKNARKKQAEAEKIGQAARADLLALMVWADDGGAVGSFNHF
ncbi:MAG: hypothetical protein GY943_06060 [Chloroflexi bacterium]|nr:hypothetical protein [Chloroflexota bacterium]